MSTLPNTFWQQYQRFLHVTLLTETPHPLSSHLSEWAQQDLPKALDCLKIIDLQALEAVAAQTTHLTQLTNAVQNTLQNGHRVFILGCGASGRMAVSLEWLWRQSFPHQAKQVVGVIAGGDSALIRSIEQFEDHAAYGMKQLQQQGFTAHDLLISTSASGESRFIVQATLEAAALCHDKPWLIVCNPLEQLLARDPQHPCGSNSINTWPLVVGPMALTGSTRMQTTTAMLVVIGLALLHPHQAKPLRDFIRFYQALDQTPLIPLIEQEASSYKNKRNVYYKLDSQVGVTALTDVTERAPTFNCAPINNLLLNEPPAPYAVRIIGSKSAQQAWQQLLQREPICLDWPQHPATAPEYLMGFDLSEDDLPFEVCHSRAGGNPEPFEITLNKNLLVLNYGTARWSLDVATLTPLFQQTLLKLLLNNHSTLVMGRLGHYRSNLMTFVSPSNAKLIDRVIRTIQTYREQQTGIKPEYKPLAEQVLASMDSLKPNESLIEKFIGSSDDFIWLRRV